MGKKKKKERVRKGKHTKKARVKIKKGTLYDISSGGAKRQRKFCPKCGPGTFMAAHKNRVVCGNCRYTEMK